MVFRREQRLLVSRFIYLCGQIRQRPRLNRKDQRLLLKGEVEFIAKISLVESRAGVVQQQLTELLVYHSSSEQLIYAR